ncbi:Phthiocerol/phthiodiolone dimycocerosyl transferase C-terminus [Sinosporangium album]|uniref:Phthiocerol/phthiodiolone dimycocerosyl transferase n=1 Tax=Sinosporangium album TaxID=504805 RepID=A0A1G7YDH5_9ACTN|nr:hypothetical protein [Sinosporangium album]SDG94602.1 Phthiocerol/phthiodiolone dimycocerosyl transferase C-terminus [Sinosporangium album]
MRPRRYLDPSEAKFALAKVTVTHAATVTGPLDDDLLAAAFDRLTEAEAVLRATIVPEGHGLLLAVSPQAAPTLELVDGGEDDYWNLLYAGLDAARGLVRLVRVREGEQSRVMLTLHHAIADARFGIALFDRLWQIYTDLAHGVALPPPERGHTLPGSIESLLPVRLPPALLAPDPAPGRETAGPGATVPGVVPGTGPGAVLPPAPPAVPATLSSAVSQAGPPSVPPAAPSPVPPAAPSPAAGGAPEGALPVPGDRPRVGRLVLPEAETRRLLTTASVTRTSLHTLVCAALLTAVARSGLAGARTTLTCRTPIDLRDRVVPKVEPTEATNFISGWITAVDIEDDLAVVARSVKRQLDEAIQRGEPHRLVLDPERTLRYILRPCDAVVTNMGRIPEPRLPDGTSVSDVRVLINQPPINPTYVVTTYQGRLSVDVALPPAVAGRDTLDALVAQIGELLAEAATPSVPHAAPQAAPTTR